MSRHRTIVIAAVEQLRQTAASALNAELLETMRARGTRELMVDLLRKHSARVGDTGTFALEVLAALPAAIDDLREAQVEVSLRFSVRDVTCVVRNHPATRRQVLVADATIKARITTRWVNIWRESERRVEWSGQESGTDFLSS